MDTDRNAREVNVITKVNLVLCLFILVQLLVTKKSILEHSLYLAMYLFSIKALIRDKKTRQAPVVIKMDSVIHQINHYPVDKYYGNKLHYPLDRGLSHG